MRILLSFFGGFILFFFLFEAFVSILRKIGIAKKNLPFNHSFLGLAILVAGIISLIINYHDSYRFLISVFAMGSGFGLIAHHFLSQSFFFFKKREQAFATRHEQGIERFLEILPGTAMWLAILSPIWLSFILPFAVAYLVIIADVYWFITAVKISTLVYIGHKKLDDAKKADWPARLEKDFPQQWKEYYHLFVLPTYKESLEVLSPAFDAIASSDYPKDKIFLAVGMEEREQQKNPEKIESTSKYLNEHIAKKIGGVFITIHPYGLPGEIAGPGTNRNWALRSAVKEFNKRGIKLEQVIVTTLDADFVIHERFLAGMTHKYLSTPPDVRLKRSFTGTFFYWNNYWQAPAAMRIIATGTAFWQLSEMVGSDKYINFASMSINMKSLLEIGLWIPDKVNDDSGFYWKAYYHFNGDYKVIPHFMPISADTNLDVSFWKTVQNQYGQLKRWAYGVEHIPFIVTQYFKNTDMNFWDKTDKLFFIMWSYFKWGSVALFITFASFFIPIVNPGYTQSAVAYNLPVISSWILTGAFIGLFATMIIHEKTAPKRPASWSLFKKTWSVIQWLVLPLAIVTIGVIPAIDAQTSLMLGRYLEYRVTNKARVPATT